MVGALELSGERPARRVRRGWHHEQIAHQAGAPRVRGGAGRRGRPRAAAASCLLFLSFCVGGVSRSSSHLYPLRASGDLCVRIYAGTPVGSPPTASGWERRGRALHGPFLPSGKKAGEGGGAFLHSGCVCVCVCVGCRGVCVCGGGGGPGRGPVQGNARK